MLRNTLAIGAAVLLAVPAMAPLQVADAGIVPQLAPLEPSFDTGIATWYGESFEGKPTANGERFRRHQMTAAHRRFPLGSMVLITDLDTQRSIAVRINDRGPWIRGRVADLSEGAAHKLGIHEKGVARVRLDLLDGRAN